MPNDLFYGGDCELRIGVMADPATDPTTWHKIEFVSLNLNPQRERRARPLLGQPRNNAIDPVKPIPGLSRVGADLVVDADSRQLPRLLRTLLGAPATTGPSGSIYTHVWASGATTPVYAALQLKTGATEIRVVRGLVLSAISVSGGGENVQDYDVQLSLRGLSRARLADFLTGTVNAVPTPAPINRSVFRADGVAASNTLEASWSWDRQLAEDIFMSITAEVSGLRPNGGQMTGSARFRAVAGAFDTLEEADTVFAPDLQMVGSVANHLITFAHPHALLEPGAVPISGPGLIERAFSWSAFQDATTPGAQITIANDVASYATA